jgi:hypothetical protein
MKRTGEEERVFAGMAEQKNRPPAEKKRPKRSASGVTGTILPPDLAIPRWVAPLQSPTPFRQATSIVLQASGVRSTSKNGKASCAKLDCQKRAYRAKTSRTRSPALATKPRSEMHDDATNDGRKLDSGRTTITVSTERRAHSFTCRF